MWTCDGVANRSWICVDLVIVTTLVCLVPKEVDCRVLYPTGLLCLVLEMLQTISLVPSSREDIEGDLSTNRVPVPNPQLVQSKKKK